MQAVFLDFGSVSTGGDLDLSSLRSTLPTLQVHDVTPDELVDERIAGREIVLLNKAEITRRRIESNPNLKLVALTATGVNNVDVDAAQERGVAVCNIRDYCTASVAQHVFATLLTLTHSIREYDRELKAGAWQKGEQFTLLNYPIRELAGRTLGIVGYGVLGQAVARIAEAFGMRVLVASRPGTDCADGRMPLEALLPIVDVLSLHCPITDATRGLIGARELSLMRPDAVLINTARGGLVDADALAFALREGLIGGAAIDVLTQEPPVDGNPLLAGDLHNLIVTPHTAWAAQESRQRAIDELSANVRDFIAGGRRGRVV
jgi:glycerate dehydrogenase